MLDDNILVRRCLSGEVAATQAFIERFQADIFGLCFRMLHHRQDAEDVTQEVFLRIFRSLHRWDEVRPLRPWVIGIAINRCRTWISQRGKRPELVEYLNDTPARTTEDDSRELVQELTRALSELRPEYRMVFVLYHEQGRSYEEISQVVDRPVGTIKTWLHRARFELLADLRQRGMVPDATNDRLPETVSPLQPRSS